MIFSRVQWIDQEKGNVHCFRNGVYWSFNKNHRFYQDLTQEDPQRRFQKPFSLEEAKKDPTYERRYRQSSPSIPRSGNFNRGRSPGV